jgi:hypothetical protein
LREVNQILSFSTIFCQFFDKKIYFVKYITFKTTFFHTQNKLNRTVDVFTDM